MPRSVPIQKPKLLFVLLLVFLLAAVPSSAQVVEVRVGVTPQCPYGLEACWGVAREGLLNLEGVESIASYPDTYNCTAIVKLKHKRLPALDQWPKQFKKNVGEIQLFRGVEITIRGEVEKQADAFALSAPGLSQAIPLEPLQHKLQWNFKKKAYRGPEPEEKEAYKHLAAMQTQKDRPRKFEITGPLRKTSRGFVLEVREFFPLSETN